MKRRQLLEIHEQPWCPAEIRDGATDCLRAIANLTQQYRFVLPLLEKVLMAGGSRQIVDLCSGGAGPWLSLAPRLQRRSGRSTPVLLTDLFPNRQSSENENSESGDSKMGGRPANVTFVATPVDATQLPADMPGLRTLFTAFHHFEPATAQAILQNAVDQKQPIAIFEQTRRSIWALPVMLLLPLLAWLVTPFLRPRHWSRFFWTYIIPIIPAVLCFDGIVSCLRTYEPDELRALTEQLHGDAYTWESGRVRSPLSPIGVTYLLGWTR